MKTLHYIAFAACLIFVTPQAFAQAAQEKQVLESVSNEETKVKNAFAQWGQALSSGDPGKVVDLYSKDAILLATLSPKPLTSQKEREEYFKKLMAKPGLAVRVKEEHIRLLDENNAVLSGLYDFVYQEAGKEVAIPARYSFVYQNRDGKWLIVEHHSSKVPEAQ
jgi:uncharacterized protein (TIGR02246 family)